MFYNSLKEKILVTYVDTVERKKASRLYDIGLVNGVVCLFSAILTYSAEFLPIVVVISVLSAIIYFSIPLLFILRFSLSTINNIVLLTGGSFIAICVLLTGGLNSYVLPWTGSWSLFTLLFANRRWANRILIIAIIYIGLLGYLSHIGYDFPKQYNLAYDTLTAVYCFVGLAILLYYNGYLFEEEKNQAFAEVNSVKEELLQLNQTKDRIFSVIGHDLKKPALAFRGITKKVNFLLEQEEYETLRQLGDTIETEALALNKLTDNLLNWALLQKQIISYRPAPLNLSEVVREEVQILDNMARYKNISVRVNIPAELIIYADLNAFRTTIRNLVDNAIKYTKENGSVTVSALAGEKGVILSVKDTGIGIPKEKLNTIFDLYQEKSEKGTAGEKGTGLGLHLVFELVLLNKGTIRVESKEMKGTTFHVVLPVAS